MKEYYLASQKIDYQVLNGIADLVRVLNSENKVIFVNRSMEQVLGYDIENKVCNIEGSPFNPEITERALATGQVIQREEIIDNNYFSVKCSPIIGLEGSIIGVVEVFRNITTEKKLQRELIEKNKLMTNETIAASRVQQTMLPEKGFVKNVKLDYLYMPSNILSGDIFDCFEINEDNIAVYIADTVGHGFAASMVTMFIKSVLRILPKHVLLYPGKTLKNINQRFSSLKLDIENYFTCFYGVYNRRDFTFTYANAGHLPLVMKCGEDKIEYLETEGFPISRLFVKSNYTEECIKLYCSDRLLFMTDGIIEAKNSEGKVFGLRKVEKIMLQHHIDEMKILKNELQKFLDTKQRDDMSALLLNFW
ncbi:MAG: SpoIIE family protein phosphatase [Tissierellia bacterium]|nr:SpoIIE family protein phosphatase [Tissierellia bacterium]